MGSQDRTPDGLEPPWPSLTILHNDFWPSGSRAHTHIIFWAAGCQVLFFFFLSAAHTHVLGGLESG